MDYSTPGFEGMHVWKEVKNLFNAELQAVEKCFSVCLIEMKFMKGNKRARIH